MKLSIIIPLYNKEKYIERCLKSLLNQGLSSTNYEIIIVDDGSIDSSVSTVENYANNNGIVNIKLIMQNNQGPSAARNNGLLEAEGDYLYFLDADDVLSNKALSVLIPLANEYDLDILEFDTKEIEEGKLTDLPDLSSVDMSGGSISVMPGTTFITKHGFRNQAWRYLIRRKFLLDTGILFDKDMRAYEDLIFTARVFLLSNKTSKVNIDAHRYVKVAESIVTTKNPKKNLEFILCMVKAVQELDYLIKKVDKSRENHSNLVNKLKNKQQIVVYALLVRAFKYRIKTKELKSILTKLEVLEAYPMNPKLRGIGKGNLFHSKLILPIFNNKFCLISGLEAMRFLTLLKK